VILYLPNNHILEITMMELVLSVLKSCKSDLKFLYSVVICSTRISVDLASGILTKVAYTN
jgi:hypothetical protein